MIDGRGRNGELEVLHLASVADGRVPITMLVQCLAGPTPAHSPISACTAASASFSYFAALRLSLTVLGLIAIACIALIRKSTFAQLHMDAFTEYINRLSTGPTIASSSTDQD